MQLTPRDKRILQIAGVVLPLLLLLYFFVLRPDDGEDVALPEFPTGATGLTGATGGSPSVTPSETPRETLPPVSLAGSRDPFSIPPGLELTGGGVGPTTSPGATGTVPPTTTASPTSTFTPPTSTFTPPPPTTPPSTGTPTQPSTSTPPPPPPPPEEPGHKVEIGGHTVKLHSIAGNEKSLEVSVDGKRYTVEPGATFDDNFKLVRIDGRCAKFLFGDQSFELCEK
jgi:hypothetical protein